MPVCPECSISPRKSGCLPSRSASDIAVPDLAGTLWDDGQYGPEVYALGGGKGRPDPALLKRVRAAIQNVADTSCDVADKRALRWGGNWYMPMLVGQQTTPLALQLAVAQALFRSSDRVRAECYLATLYTTCDYVLGCNPLNMTWATALGVRHPLHVFHMDAWYNGKDRCHPGVIPYGPWRDGRSEGQGPWDVAWPHKTVYPPIGAWPGNERWFDNRCSPMNSEFTIHQTIGPSAAIFGILCAPGPAARAAAPREELSSMNSI